jgi:integral membrane protein
VSEDGRTSVNSALKRFRFMAYVVGIGLLALVAAMLIKYVGDQPAMMRAVGPLHGFAYAVYLVVAVDLSLKARWSIKGTLLVLLAGTIPFLSFYAERKVVERVQARVAL